MNTLLGAAVAALLLFGGPGPLIPCDTDTDCMEKNGGDGAPAPAGVLILENEHGRYFVEHGIRYYLDACEEPEGLDSETDAVGLGC